MGRLILAAAGLAFLPGCACKAPPPAAPIATAPPADAIAEPPILGIEEASGVTRAGDRLLIVGDHEPGVYYSYPASSAAVDEPTRLPLDPGRIQRHRLSAGPYALDLEAVGVLADGRPVILSERLSALFDADGFVAVYGRSLAEFGGRGFEGVAVRPLADGSSRVALLWEGGYPEPTGLPRQVRDHVRDLPLAPRVVVHDLAAGARNVQVGGASILSDVELQVPRPVGAEPQAQRFRAPDFVWHQWPVDGAPQWGFLALISSGWGSPPVPGSEAECTKVENGKTLRWCYKWLQRFTVDGKAWGEPFDLDQVLPEELRSVNWEGMGWFEEGRTLVLVYDEKIARRRVSPQEAFLLPLPAGW